MMTLDPQTSSTPLVRHLCDQCSLPCAEQRGTVIKIRSWHREQRHDSVLSLHELAAKAGYRLVPLERRP